ncbi:metastasis-associated in colon cancer protein 1 [Hypanus sabinus]|uniref:metastasis-associated in colon cancer protein 1 n=1 Tax=Hypanus sabinus TaxID=79690 RepID=UPI0028C45252|nr:metastasis-associated in colon cancer protein 1 [Hypanus sabinus]XP_059828654.1 metastasis-associated in colon cancer protein 1 [Hypanus sabinus]XP_059828655.1 metastasis-associated in colon cancer protein 1 [Hypanus sabinus]XP_059828656.1 metastasis-associated in colon cancer protein 1 [Hypanus sabinus]
MAVRTHSPRHTRSKSEGTLIDLDENQSTTHLFVKENNNLPGISKGQESNLLQDWDLLVFDQPNHAVNQSTNPFWNGLSGSNPFLDDIAKESDDNVVKPSSALNENALVFENPRTAESIGSSADELDVDNLIYIGRPFAKQHGRWKSASDILDFSNKDDVPQNNRPLSEFIAPNLESFQNDREAYKAAWLNHRQLTRSCLDLDMVSQNPGWGQTQAIETLIVCKMDQNGGSLHLPESDVSVHVPEGHVPPGEIQELAIQALLEPPQLLNNDFCTTIGPLLEMKLSNFNTKGCISLEMRVTAEVKTDPMSQVMTDVVCLCSDAKEGPFEKLHNIYIYKDVMQVKLEKLSPCLYVVPAVEAKCIQPPALSVWDYLDKMITVGVYGPKYIHPVFTAVCTIFCHNEIPQRLADMKRNNKNLPPVVLQLWGKHQFHLERPQDLQISVIPTETKYDVQETDQTMQIDKTLLTMGKTIRQPFSLSMSKAGEVNSFQLVIQVKDVNHDVITQFSIQTPMPTGKSNMKRRYQKRKESLTHITSCEPSPVKHPVFKDREINIINYGVALKSVLRQPKIEYLLEYFKGDTIALLGLDKVKVIGQTRIKEWYVGFLRGKIGLVHCKNVKVISKEQVMDYSEVKVTTKILLDQITIPMKRLTYMYSSLREIITENITSWKPFAEVLGYTNLPLDTISRTPVESESERVACILENLKEDCHAGGNKMKRKFLHEIVLGLLKLDHQGIVVRLLQDVVMLSAAVELGVRWRELAEKLAKLSKHQIDAYEAPHRTRSGEVGQETMWKPAHDFLYTWSIKFGDGYQDVLQELQNALDKMKSPITRHWRHLTGVLVLVNCLEILRASAFPRHEEE